MQRHLTTIGLTLAILATSALAQADSILGINEPLHVLVETPPPSGFRSALRRKLTTKSIEARYGVKFAANSLSCPRVVILVHGFNSSRDSTARLVPTTRSNDFEVGSFAYPNDQAIANSAHLLSAELRRLATNHPEVQISLVTHSMGGLVARECIENTQLYPGNVDQIIMVAPPNHGSLLARYAVATDLWEHWLGRRWGGPWSRTRDAIVDGLGEAANDLVPGSQFLTTLNNRPRNAKVTYTMLLGSGATITDEEILWAKQHACKALSAVRARKTAACLDDYMTELEEIVAGRGDGVVAVKRARLEGVEDVVVLPFGHVEVVCKAANKPDPSAAVKAAREVILDRLLRNHATFDSEQPEAPGETLSVSAPTSSLPSLSPE